MGSGLTSPSLIPGRNVLYVTTELDNSVTIINPKTRKIVGSIPTGQPQSHMLVLSHDGRRGYTANVGPGTVSVLDLVSKKTITVHSDFQRDAAHLDLQRRPLGLHRRPDETATRRHRYPATNKVKTWVPLPGTGYGSAPTPDGRFLLIAVPPTNQVAVVDLTSLQVVRKIDVPAAPQEVLIRPDGKVAYVSCSTSGKVAAIDLAQWKVQNLIAAGNFADGLAWAK